MGKFVLISLLFLFFGFNGITQPFEINFILEINDNKDCPPTEELRFDIRFEDIPLKIKRKDYPFYSIELNEKYFVDQLSLNLFYKERQLEIPPLSLNTFDNGHFKIQLDSCKITDCLQIISYGTYQYQTTDCTIRNFPSVTIEILDPQISSGENRKQLIDLVENDSIPNSTRERLRKILSSTFSSLDSYYSSLDN